MTDLACRNSADAPSGRSSRAGFVKSFHDRLRSCHQVKIAVNRVIRSQPVVGRREQRNVVSRDLHGLQGRAVLLLKFSLGFAAVLEIVPQQNVVLGVKQNADRGTFAQIHIATDHGDVGDDLAAEKFAQFGLLEHQLILHPPGQLGVVTSEG